MAGSRLRVNHFLQNQASNIVTGWMEHQALHKSWHITIRTGTALVTIETIADSSSGIHDPYTLWNGPNNGAAFGPGTWVVEASSGQASRVSVSSIAGGATVSASVAVAVET